MKSTFPSRRWPCPYLRWPAAVRLLAGCLVLLLLATPATGSAPQPPAPAEPYAVEEDHFFHRFFQVAEVSEPVHLVLVDKEEQRLLVLEHNSSLRVVAQYSCGTGENAGRKAASGDARTPEGIYFITQIYEDSKVTVFGNRAFKLDYPNPYDTAEGRDGDGIYIHGTNKPLTANSTNGCISMANKDLDSLEAFLGKYITPVVIVGNIRELAENVKQTPSGKDLAQAKATLLPSEISPEKVTFDLFYLINLGRRSVAVGEYVYRQEENSRMRGYSRAYLELSQGSGWSSRKRIWQYAPVQIFPASPVKLAARLPLAATVEFPPAEVLAAAENAGPAAARLGPEIAAMPVSGPVPAALPAPARAPAALGKKAGGPKPQDQGRLAQVAGSPLQSATEPPPGIAPVEHKSGPASGFAKDRQAVLDFIESWRKAWQSKEIDAYIGAYDNSFKQGRQDLAAWRAYKKKLNKKYTTIKVEITDIDINWTATGAMVSFQQLYRSDMFFAKGRKTLELVYSDRAWRIRRELMATDKG